MRSIALAVTFASMAMLNACSSGTQPNTPSMQSEKGDKKKRDKDKDSDTAPNADTAQASAPCDKSLWDHVYNRERLEVQKDCTTVTGTITERSTDDDGDEHMLLKLDAGQEDLLTKKNNKKKDDNLVIEAVCVGKPALKKVGDACNNFSNAVALPKVGDRVGVTGSLVLDTHNGWAEIHPITSIRPE